MVEYSKQLSEYNVDDIVYINWLDEWRKFTIIRFELHAEVKSVSETFIHIDSFYFSLSTTALTEQQYKDMQLERKFKW